MKKYITVKTTGYYRLNIQDIHKVHVADRRKTPKLPAYPSDDGTMCMEGTPLSFTSDSQEESS